jgi:hypothetical protein
MRKIISLICLLLPIAVFADELQLKENAPDRYVVVKGDTLWDISAKFFKDPWKWPQIWGYNKDTIQNPHWIYPGNVVFLDPGTHTLKVDDGTSPDTASAAPAGTAPATVDLGSDVPSVEETPNTAGSVKMSPRARAIGGSRESIPVISLKEIGPFLSRPLVIEDDELENSPVLVGTYEHRQLIGAGDIAYAQNMPDDKGESWQIYRPSRTFRDPDTDEVLGQEVFYLGDATVENFGKITTLRVTSSVREIGQGDRFAQTTAGFASNFVPRVPGREISARVISVYGGVTQAGQNNVIALNKGSRDGLESGHVLALYQKGEEIRSRNLFKRNIVLPDARYGLLFVFRVFNKVSYALVLETTFPVQVLDRASNPK